jgi:DNA-binding transcriptional MerR regulator
MPKRKDVEALIKALRDKGTTLGEIAKQLNDEGYKTPARGSKITPSFVNYVLNKSKNSATVGSRKNEDQETIPFRLLKSVITDVELSDKQKVAILRSLYKL